ncbi:MAG: FAD-dependent oxidoreductase [Mycobacterium sp.]
MPKARPGNVTAAFYYLRRRHPTADLPPTGGKRRGYGSGEKDQPFPDHSRSTVAVVGAGAAGLASARRLTDAGIHVVGLEAKDRIGGYSLGTVAVSRGSPLSARERGDGRLRFAHRSRCRITPVIA